MGTLVSRFLVMVIAASLLIALPAIAQQHLKLPAVPNPMVVAAPEIGKFGGTFVITNISDPRTFNILVAQETSSTGPLGDMLEALAGANPGTARAAPSL